MKARVESDMVNGPDAVAEVYRIKDGFEWAHISICEETLTFLAASSFGTFGYNWANVGTRPFKEFLAGLDFDYFMKKTRGRSYKEFDVDASVKNIKEIIIENRRAGWITKDLARSAFDELSGVWPLPEANFLERLTDSPALMNLFDGDYCDLARQSPTSDCRGFWKVIWPKFLERISAPEKVAA